jgi:hypothetical protein
MMEEEKLLDVTVPDENGNQLNPDGVLQIFEVCVRYGVALCLCTSCSSFTLPQNYACNKISH